MDQSTKSRFNAQTTLKVALLIVATVFLTYCIYWLVNGLIWGYTLTNNLLNISRIPLLGQRGTGELVALLVQEYCSVANSFIILFCGVFAFQSAVYYCRKNKNYIRKLRWTIILLAVFSLLLVPASLHHLLGVTFIWSMVDIFVGLSYLIQAVLIAPPLLILSQKIKKPQNQTPIEHWVAIAAPSFVFALYFKYLFLWIDTLSPMGPQTATAASIVGAVNSILTLAIAGTITSLACFALYKNKNIKKRLAGAAIIIVGLFFIMYSIVAVFVPAYAWFWYLTDFWMITVPLIGITLLIDKENKNNHYEKDNL